MRTRVEAWLEGETRLAELANYIESMEQSFLEVWPLIAAGATFLAAIAVAVILHRATFALLKRTAVAKVGSGALTLKRIYGPTRLAMILIAVLAVLPAAGIDPELKEIVRRALNVGMIILLGWSAIVAINTGWEYTSRKHRLDLEDNLEARKHHTQMGLLRRSAVLGVILFTFASCLLAFPSLREYGLSLFASAGAAGIILGFAARPILTNLIAGLQIALTQPIRIDDVVFMEGEFGWIEEIRTTYVVIRIWDWRRLVVPLSHFIEHPFQNWTRENASLIGEVKWYLDPTAPVEEMRTHLATVLKHSPLWDGRIVNLQVTDMKPDAIEVRALMSSKNAQNTWDLRCYAREAMIVWLQREHPGALPRYRATIESPEQRVTAALPLRPAARAV